MPHVFGDSIYPGFVGNITWMKYISGGLHVVNTVSQRNNNIPYLVRMLDSLESTMVYVISTNTWYKLISNPLTDVTADSDWSIVAFAGGAASPVPVGDWDPSTNIPALLDSGAIGINGQFYYVINADQGVTTTISGLFNDAAVTVYTGDWIISIGSGWAILSAGGRGDFFWPLGGSANITGDVLIDGAHSIGFGQITPLTAFNIAASDGVTTSRIASDPAGFYSSLTTAAGVGVQFAGSLGGAVDQEYGLAAAGRNVFYVGYHSSTGVRGFTLLNSPSGTSLLRMQISEAGVWKMNYGSDATGGMTYRNSSGNEVRLPVGAGNSYLTVTGGIPSWSVFTIVLGGNFTTSGSFTTTLTVTANTAVTLPTSGTLATNAVFTSGVNGLVPASGGGTTNFLRADGSWAAPPGGGGGGGITNTAGNNEIPKSDGTNIVPSGIFSASSGNITTGAWQATKVGLLYGGTNSDLSASAAIGDVIQASSTTAFQRLASVATGNVLISGGTATLNSWGKVTSAHTDATIQVSGLSWLLASGGTLVGANVITGTITNTLKYKFDNLGVTITDGAGQWLANTQGAGAGAQQQSPYTTWEGQGWATSPVASQQVKVVGYALPVQGAANPSVSLVFATSVNGSGYTTRMTLNSSGILAVATLSALATNNVLGIRSQQTSVAGVGVQVSNGVVNFTATSGTVSHLGIGLTGESFAPTSGTAAFNSALIQQTINQTGGANGQITGVNGNLTITAAVNVTGYDWNPVNPGNISGTHLAWRNTSGAILHGGTTLTAGSVLVDLQSTTLALLVTRVTNVAAVATPVNGMIVYDAALNQFRLRENGAWIGAAISNTAANNEIPKSNGTNIIPSGIFSSSSGNITTGAWQGTPVAGGFGGTGLAIYAVGDLLYASGTTTFAKRAAVATGSVLGSAGVATAPAYLAVSNGLTATATTFKLGGGLTANTTIFANGFDFSIAGAGGSFALTDGLNWFGEINIQADSSVTPFGGVSIIDLNGGASVDLGGSTVEIAGTTFSVITPVIKLLANGSGIGQVPTATDAFGTWTWQTANPMTNVGDLIRGGTAGAVTRLAAVATGSVLGSAGVNTAPAYLAVSNGLTATATTLKLGGTLSGGVTTQVITGVASSTNLFFTDRDVTLGSGVANFFGVSDLSGAGNMGSGIGSTDLSTTQSVSIKASIPYLGGIVVEDTRSSPRGLEYSATGYVTQTHSLTDREYVLGAKALVGTQTFAASTTGLMPLVIPHGAAPTGGALVDGGLWTTTTGVFARINGATVGPFGTGGGGSLNYTLNAQGGNYTYVLTDATTQTLVQATSASATNFTIPPNSSVSYSTGAMLNLVWDGTGQPSWVAGAGVTINSSSGTLTLPARYAVSTAIKVATNTWYLWNGLPGNPFSDDVALVKNSTDNTKLLLLSAASISASTTRTWTFPDVNGTVARNDAAQSFFGTQTFTPTATVAGLNVGATTANPSSPVNGDAYYNSTANELRARINGAWVALGAGGGGITFPLSSSQLTINNPAATFAYTFTAAAIAAARTITLPLLTGNDVMVTADFTQTLTNKTLTAPKIAHAGFISDENGNAQITFNTTGSAVNSLSVNNTATGVSPLLTVTGSDTNIGFTIRTKGTGGLTAYGNLVTIGGANYASGSVGPISILGNNSTGSGQAGSNIIIKSGPGVTGNASSGNIFLDTDVKTGSGIVGSISLFKSTADYGAGEKVVYWGNATTNPSTNPTGGGLMFVKSADNKPYWRTPAGVETVMINPFVNSATANALMMSDGANAVNGPITYSSPNLSFSGGASATFSVIGTNQLTFSPDQGTETGSLATITLTTSGTTVMKISILGSAANSTNTTGGDVRIVGGSGYVSGATNGGDVVLLGGVPNGAGTTGKIRLTAASTVGYVWTATDTTGAGSWQVASGGSGWAVTGTTTLTGAVIIDETTTGANTLKFKSAGLAVTPVDGKGIWLYNDSAAGAGAQQISGSVVQEGQGWATTPVQSQSVKFRYYVLPVQGAANPSGNWLLQSSINAAAYTTALTITSAGALTSASAISGTTLTASNGLITNSGAAEWRAGGTAYFSVNSVSTAGTYFNFGQGSGLNYTATSGTVSEIAATSTGGFAPTSGTAVFNQVLLDRTVNQTGGANGQITWLNAKPTITAAVNVTGYDWNPTTPANISGTHLAFRATAGGILIGATTITASTRFDLRGVGTTTGIALRIADSGNTLRFTMLDNGSFGFFGIAAAAQQTSGANLTNSVTSGGTDDTVANFTDLTLYANDAAAIRNDIYQLARKLKQVNDALRLYGLLT